LMGIKTNSGFDNSGRGWAHGKIVS
jgi:hypothetical protein